MLVLHGGFCSLEPLRPIAEAVAREFSVHAYERPGHGRSPDIPGEYSYSAETDRAVAVLDTLGLDRVHVVGYSDGAIIGLQLARDRPERVRSLVAISGNIDPSGFTIPEDQLAAALAAAGTPPDDRPDPEGELYARLSPDGPAHAEVVLGKLRRLWTAQPRIDPADLARVTTPTLIISGDRDTVRPEHSMVIAASLGDAQLCIVPDASHALVAEHPALLAQLVLAFLRAQPHR